ncbi:response regulator [Paenibacillus alba]|uniref:hybrid sensor histidine kinase/response regulator n=1 Tax=Paenibacillus alba TaxID=1197127 RepID=UPI001562EE76|nr:ATP-binding protein [Paenibacillus alba]NQX71771.1 response regulator [Paenibacillus alba]
MRKQLTVLIGMLAVFAIITSLFIYEWLNRASQYPEAQAGVLDARQWDFAKQGIIPLRGEWEFYENKLLTPQDFSTSGKALDAQRRIIQVPGGWKGIVSSSNGYGAGTYRLQIKVSNSDFYSLRGKKIRLSSHIYINGSDLGGTGKPDLSEDRFVPSNLPIFGTIKADTDTVDIIIQTASYRYLEGGLVQAPEFGLTADVSSKRDNARLADMIVITTMLVFGIYFAGMFRQWKKEPYHFFFSLFCLSLGLFFSIDNEIVMTTLFPAMSFLLLQKMLFILPYVSVLSFACYIYLYLENKKSPEYKWLSRVSYVCLALLIAIPNEYLINILWLGIVLHLTLFAFIIRWIFRNRNNGVQIYYILLGLFFLIVSWVYAQTRYQLALDNPYYMIVTPLLLVLSQSFLMSERVREAYLRIEQLAEQLIAYDRQKDEFLIHTSHEFKTPLHGIINLAQVVIDQIGEEMAQRHRENLDFIIGQATRLSTLVNDIIDFQSLKQGSLMFHNRFFDVSSTLQATLEVLKFLRRNDQVRLVNQVPSGTFYLFTDENRLKQIIVNLVGNALKFTERGSVAVTAESQEGWLRLTIADTGAGMSEERQRALFKVNLYQDEENQAVSAFQSSGLGLKISKALALQMGGDLELKWSETGKGSVFELRLPEAKAVPREHSATRTEVAAGLEPKLLPGARLTRKEDQYQQAAERTGEVKILLVDDDSSNIKVLQELFVSSRYHVLTASNGAAALKLIQQHRSDLSLVLLDVMMPEISGYEVCRRIREENPLHKLPVLLLTVRNSPADIAMGFEAGANDFLVKPFSGKELLARVQTLLQLREAVEQAIRMETLFLQSQIKPHFVYNALSSIISLCYSDGARAGKLLGEFSNFLRLSFDLDPRHAKVSLKRELSLTKSYVELEQARFGSRLNVEWDVSVSMETLIPALIVQPLVENAIRHGIMKRLSGGTVLIQAKLEPHGLLIAVRDNGVGMIPEQLDRVLKPERLEGNIGLVNVHKRLMNEYGQGLRIESVQDKGTTVAFRIPSRAGTAGPVGEGG